ncbi:MAG TPA: ATP-binding protein [Bosea sp. (in: a-proteobacteria)]|jgi:two-component system sensor histidine kinase QseC|uniref:ATP-binding protein n=1 Tax=Bosea sp. (in: a-proteobacteria) TaxID=1871050 RepID=UPI002E0F80E9|nr:ATP-binding protein [Bosea sp. (in: a-proteobacteria)]
MNSLRGRLFAILLTATGVIWLSAVAWIYSNTHRELEHVLDTRLQEAARMVNSLVGSANMTVAMAALPGPQAEALGYERQLSCQIWSFDGRLMARSSGTPHGRLTEVPSGFSDRIVDGEPWRVYTVANETAGIHIMVGDRLGLRDRLVSELIKGLLAPALLIAPLLGLLIWISLGRGLRPLRAMAHDVGTRDADDMSPVDAAHAPAEVKPLAQALNGLFAKVETARRHEREVTAFAAHELRTPLAGLKTQAQIAMATEDMAVRQGALQRIVLSVDRTTRLVRQLLALAKLDANGAAPAREALQAGALFDEITDSAPGTAQQVSISLDPALRSVTIQASRELLTLALRNLHENAVQHSPAGGRIVWRATASGHGIAIEDEGPGIPEDEMALVTQRFFRGRHKSAIGTGLGLAIADAAARRLGAALRLSNRADRSGLRAEIEIGP